MPKKGYLNAYLVHTLICDANADALGMRSAPAKAFLDQVRSTFSRGLRVALLRPAKTKLVNRSSGISMSTCFVSFIKDSRTVETEEEANTHFADLPDAVPVKVLQFFSDNPRSTSWREYFSPEALLDLSWPGHPLYRAAQAELKALRLLGRRFGDDPVSVETVKKILDAYGDTWETLRLRTQQDSTISWVSLLPQCRNLKKIQVQSYESRRAPLVPPELPIDSLISAQRNLEELAIWSSKRTMEVLKAVSMKGTGLQRIDVWSSIAERETLKNMLKTVGKTLLSLALNFRPDSELQANVPRLDLKWIASCCPRITDICLRNVPDFSRQDEFALYCLYGAQLRNLSLFGAQFDVQSVRNLAASCPNVAVSTIGIRGDLVLLMRILGPLLSRIQTLCPLKDSDSAAAAECINVEYLSTQRRYAGVFFLRPKPNLRELVLVSNGAAAQVSETLCTIARRTGSLRSVRLAVRRFPADALLVLANTNIDLETVDVFLTLRAGENRLPLFANVMVGTVNSLSKCKSLRRITVGRNTNAGNDDHILMRIRSVADACSRFRGRNISVKLDGKEYNLWND